MAGVRRTNPGGGTRAIVGNPVHRGIVDRQLGFAPWIMLLGSKLAIAGGFQQLGTGRLDEKEHGLEKSEWMLERVTSHDNSRAAMPFSTVIEGKFNFRTHPERPFRQETDPFGRPMNLIPDQIDGIRKAYPYLRSLVSPCFALDRHNLHLQGHLLLNTDTKSVNRASPAIGS